jgi:hypothetical protein
VKEIVFLDTNQKPTPILKIALSNDEIFIDENYMLFNKVRADIWYFDSHGILILGSIFIYGILIPFLKTDHPVW